MATDPKTTGRGSDKFMLRFPDGMRERVAESAKQNNRSMNAEVINRLASSFDEAQIEKHERLGFAFGSLKERYKNTQLKIELATAKLMTLQIVGYCDFEKLKNAPINLQAFAELIKRHEAEIIYDAISKTLEATVSNDTFCTTMLDDITHSPTEEQKQQLDYAAETLNSISENIERIVNILGKIEPPPPLMPNIKGGKNALPSTEDVLRLIERLAEKKQ